MVDAALNVAAEQIVEHSAYGALLGARRQPRAHRGAPEPLPGGRRRRATAGATRGSPSPSPPTSSGWPWRRRSVARRGPSTRRLATAAGRRDRHDGIDATWRTGARERTADEIVEHLWPAGVPVARVMQPHEQPSLPPLQSRGFFEDVDHPVTGTVPPQHACRSASPGAPTASTGGPPRCSASTPTRCCVASALSEASSTELRELGVIGERPRLRPAVIGAAVDRPAGRAQ